ncbi:MAG: cupin domain-containing protein, partial [Acidithiobacillus ferrooxidans]|nr:cupin domain-containing protein [Acidithiobacillus ferrooxidans]
ELPPAFAQVTDISVDYAVMEHADRVAVVPGDFGWSDIGSWTSFGALIPEDSSGNRVLGESVLEDAQHCIVHSADRLTALLGVEDLIVVDTPDALLVARKDRDQDVKRIVAELRHRGHDAGNLHRTVHRPWGTYTVLEEGPRFKIKRILVKPGAALSLQMHYHRSEHWIVVSGTAKIVNGGADHLVQTNESTYIPAGTPHRLLNPGVVDLVMIEVQSGEYLGEDDIVRFDDRYGRAP